MQSFHDTLGKGSLPNFLTKAVAAATPSLLYSQAGLADRRQASYGHTYLCVHHSLVTLGAVDSMQRQNPFWGQ